MPAQKRHALTPIEMSATVELSATAGASEVDKRRSFSSTGYSGGVITDHPMFDRVAFDLSTTRLQKPQLKVLLDHKQPIGFSSAVIGNDVKVTGTLFDPETDEHARNVITKADQGFEWEQSVRIYPGKIDQYKAGDKIKLNGRELLGPLTVYRNNRIREVSFCALGADADTDANVFSIGGERIAPPTSEGTEMDQAEHDRLLAAANAERDEAKRQAKEMTDRVTALEASAKAEKLATRTEAVKGLFKAIGKEFNDANAKPYVEMSDESFSAASEAISSRAKLDPSLTEHTATGSGEVDKKSPRSILAAARAHQSQQFKIDSTVVPIDEAVVAVAGAGQITL